MRYKGKIILLQASALDTIYKVEEKARVQMYLSPVSAEKTTDSLKVAFNSNDWGMTIHFIKITKNIYEGDIVSKHESLGTATLTLYEHLDKLFCKIYYDVPGDVYDCFLELEPYETL